MQANAHNSPKPVLRLIRQGFPDRPAFGTAVSEAVLTRVAAGELGADAAPSPPRPGARVLEAGPRRRPGSRPPCEAARAAGFEPVVRLAGGRAAVFHEGTLALAWATPAERPVAGTRERFERLAGDPRPGAARARGRRPGRRGPGRVLPRRLERQRPRAHEARRDRPAADLRRRALRRACWWSPAPSSCGRRSSPSTRRSTSTGTRETAGSVADEVPGTSLADAEAALVAELADAVRARRRRARPADARPRRRARARPPRVGMISRDGGDDDHDADRARGGARGEGHPARALLRPRLRLRLHPGHRPDGREPDLGGRRPGHARAGGRVVGVERLRVADQRPALRRRDRAGRAARGDGRDAGRGARGAGGVRRRLGRLRLRLLRRPRDPHRRLHLRRARRRRPRRDPRPRSGPARGAGADRRRRVPRRRRRRRPLDRRPDHRLRDAVRAGHERVQRLTQPTSTSASG